MDYHASGLRRDVPPLQCVAPEVPMKQQATHKQKQKPRLSAAAAPWSPSKVRSNSFSHPARPPSPARSAGQ